LIQDVETALAQAATDELGVVFDLGGNTARTDVLSSLCITLRDSPVFTVVYLADNSDRTVGVSQLALGLFADRCFIDPETRVVGRGADPANRDLAADAPAWDIIEQELNERIARQLAAVAVSPTVADEFAAKLMNPTEGLALTVAAGRFTIVPQGAQGALILTEPPTRRRVNGTTANGGVAPAHTRINAAPRVLAPLGVAPAGSITNALASLDATLAKGRKAINIEETIASVSIIIEGLFADAASIEKDVDERLDLPDPATRTTARKQYHVAAQEGRHNLSEVNRMINSIETHLERVPEILRTAPPGVAVAGAKPSSFPAKWRSRIQKLRTRHEALLAKVESFEKVP